MRFWSPLWRTIVTDHVPYLSWRNFQDLIDQGVPAVHSLAGEPRIDFFVDEDGRRIGLSVRVADPTVKLEPLPFDQFQWSLVDRSGVRYLDLWTRSTDVFPEFYALLLLVGERIRIGQAPADAILQSLDLWQGLLERVGILGVEKEIGLLGELCALRMLLPGLGSGAVEAWTGPTGDAHDFRLTGREIEVKSTLSAKRVHSIHGLTQLKASEGHELLMLSLQFEVSAAAHAESLPDAVTGLRQSFATDPSALKDFNERLARLGYSDQHADLYARRYELRSLPTLIPATAIPRITADTISVDPILFPRILDVQYTIDVSGLGWQQQSHEFEVAFA